MADKILETLVLAFKSDLTGLTKGVDQATGKIKGMGSGVTGEGNKIKSTFDVLTSKVGSFAKALGAIGTIGAIWKVADDMDKAMGKIRANTGATGDSLVALKGDFKAVMGQVGSSADDVATAITMLQQRTGLTGTALQDLAAQELKLAKITGTDLTGSITATSQAFQSWKIPADQYGQQLDFLFRIHQKTGISVDALAGKVQQFGAPLRQMGFGFQESAAMIGQWEKQGVNVEASLGSMRVALKTFSKEGLDAPRALQAVIDKIRDAKNPAEAAALGFKVFGRGAADMISNIRDGKMDFATFLSDMQKSPETINKAAKESATFGGAMAKVRNQVVLALDVLGEPLMKAFDDLNPSIQNGTKGLAGIISGLTRIPEPARNAALALAALALLSGPIGKTVAVIQGIPLVVGNVAKALGIAQLQVELFALKMTGLEIGTAAASLALGGLVIAAAAAAPKIGEAIDAFLELQRVKVDTDAIIEADKQTTQQLIDKGFSSYNKWKEGAKLGAKDLKIAILGMKEELKNIYKSGDTDWAEVDGNIKKMQAEYTKRFGKKPQTKTVTTNTGGGGVDLSGLFGKGGSTKEGKTTPPPKSDPFAGAENTYTLAMAQVNAYGTGKTGELAAAKKLLNDLQYIQKKGNLTTEEQGKLELKILDAKTKINAASEKSLTPEEKKAKLVGDIHDKTQLLLGENELQNGTLEEQRTILQDQVTQLENAHASAKEILDARLALKGVEDKIADKSKDTTKELGRQVEVMEDLAMQAAQVGAGFAAASIKGDSISAGDATRSTSGLIGSAIGMLGGPAGVAIGTQIGNIAGQLIGAVFDKQDQDREKAKETSEYWQKSSEEAVKEWKEAGVTSDTELLEKLKQQWNEATGQGNQQESIRIQQRIAEVDRRNAETQQHAADIQIKAAEEQRKAADAANKAEEDGYGNKLSLDSFAGDMQSTLKRTQLDTQLKNGTISQDKYDQAIAQLDADNGLQGAKDRAASILDGISRQQGGDPIWTDQFGKVVDSGVLEVNRIVEGIKNGTITEKDGEGNPIIAGLIAAVNNSKLSVEGITQSIKDTFSQYTQTNPLPVQDVSLRNLFAVGPAQRFFVERKSEITLRIDGKADTDSIIKAISTPAGREAVFGNNIKQGAIINIIPGQA